MLKFFGLYKWLGLALLAFTLASSLGFTDDGLKPRKWYAAGEGNDEPFMGINVIATHHLGRGHHIGEFSIDGQACGNAGSPKGNSGGNTMCSISLPRHWQKGITKKVRWGVTNWKDDLSGLIKGNAGQWYEATVEVEPYTGDSNVFVHFFPNQVVRIVPNPYGPDDSDTDPTQTPPLTELPLYAPSWYWMGQVEAKQKHEGLTRKYDIDGIKEEQAKAKAYFAFLERTWRSRKMSEEEIQKRLAKEKEDAEWGKKGGYSQYLDSIMARAGLSKQEIKAKTKDMPWHIEVLDKQIVFYLKQIKTGGKK